LDPDTLAEASSGTGEGATQIIFTNEEVEVPAVIKPHVAEYVALVAQRNKDLLRTLRDALANFETTMEHASAKEANADILGVWLNQAYDMLVDQLVSDVPGLSTAKSFFDAAGRELERAAEARASLELGDWIKDQRTTISDMEQLIDRDIRLREELQREVESDYLDAGLDGRQSFFDQLVSTIDRLKQGTAANIDVLEQQFYEAWINAHFRRIDTDTPGCIEFRFEYDASENIFDFVSCSVQAPSGDRVATALNRLLDRKRLPGTMGPIDFRVRKRACFRTENLVGGIGWDCAWLDANNKVIHQPVLPNAEKALNQPGWRGTVSRFH
jgi:hypothetical protein